MYNPIFEEERDKKERDKEFKGLKKAIKKRSGSNILNDAINHVYNILKKNGMSWFKKDDGLIEAVK